MSIASEITDLSTNLAAAKAAVVTKGGTVGNTGLAGLEAEILAIPTTRQLPWGELNYYSVYTPASATTVSSTNLTFNSVSQDGLLRFMSEVLHVQSSQTVTSWWWMEGGQLMSHWDYGSAGNIQASWLASEYGINVSMTDQSQSNGQWAISYTPVSVDKTSQVNTVELASQSEYNSLAGSDKTSSSTVTIDSTTIVFAAIKSFTFGDNITSVPAYFLANSGVEKIDFAGSAVTSIGNYFLSGCSSFDSQVVLPTTTTSIGTYFLNNCTNFDFPIIGKSVTTIDGYFLSGCTKFNSRLDFPAVTTIGTSFLRYRDQFDHSLSFPALTSVSTYFLSDCTRFNSTLSVPNLKTASTYFLANCTVFNQPLTLTSLESMGDRSVYQCPSFNKVITMPAVKTIGRFFMYGNKAFNQNFTIPSTVTSIADNFFGRCDSMISTITCETSAANANNNTGTFSTNNSSAPCYVTGIKLSGTYKNEWHTKFADRSSSGNYRKTIVV